MLSLDRQPYIFLGYFSCGMRWQLLQRPTYPTSHHKHSAAKPSGDSPRDRYVQRDCHGHCASVVPVE